MKSYNEAQNGKSIDWNKRLNKDPHLVTRAELDQWDYDASSWVTCACGNQCDIIPRDDNGSPEDEQLKELGMDFMDEISDLIVQDDDGDPISFSDAQKVLVQIEQRSKELIDEILNNKTIKNQ